MGESCEVEDFILSPNLLPNLSPNRNHISFADELFDRKISAFYCIIYCVIHTEFLGHFSVSPNFLPNLSSLSFFRSMFYSCLYSRHSLISGRNNEIFKLFRIFYTFCIVFVKYFANLQCQMNCALPVLTPNQVVKNEIIIEF